MKHYVHCILHSLWSYFHNFHEDNYRLHKDIIVGYLLSSITVVTTENKTHKQQLQVLMDKGRHDDELIEALFVCVSLLSYHICYCMSHIQR